MASGIVGASHGNFDKVKELVVPGLNWLAPWIEVLGIGKRPLVRLHMLAKILLSF
jgi:hypothetical protein